MAKRIHREELELGLAQALLNVPCAPSSPDDYAADATSVWDRLESAKAELLRAVEAANKALEGNPLAEILAENVSRQRGRRGDPRIVVDGDGKVQLEVHYGKPDDEAPAAPRRRTRLPPIKELREQADALGIDHAPFGKAKTKLIAAIKKKREKIAQGDQKSPAKNLTPKTDPVPQDPPPKPRTKRAEALTPAKVVHLDDDDDDLDALLNGTPTPPKPPRKPSRKVRKPPRRGTPATGSTKKKKGLDLGALVKNAEDMVDIDAILAAPPPELPQEDE